MNDLWSNEVYMWQKQEELRKEGEQARLIRLASGTRKQASPFPMRIWSWLNARLVAWDDQIEQPSGVATSPSTQQAATK